MRSGIRIGKLLGIRLRVDWSWFLILILMAWNLSTRFGVLHSDWSPWVASVLGTTAALLFFVTVLIHELAHSLVAQRGGTDVRSITLFMFGGVSDIQREPDSPRSEFSMAIVGPLTSLVIGFALVLVTSAAVGPLLDAVRSPQQAISRLSPGTTLVVWLGSVNLMLGLFNLLPAFPLDGGRMLRATLWAATRSLRRATRWAAGVSQGIAWLMIVSGVSTIFGLRFTLFGGGLANGLWLAFIGWFLSSAAATSYRRVVVRDILEDVPVERMMRRDPLTVGPDIPIGTLVDEFIMVRDDRAFPVTANGELSGIVTLEDFRSVPRSRWHETSVRDVMTPAGELVTVMPDEDASDALDKLGQHDIRQLPVVDDGHLVGMVRRSDVIRWLQFQGSQE
jgi:Zn-dependent protease/predicted transcriptional regulator